MYTLRSPHFDLVFVLSTCATPFGSTTEGFDAPGWRLLNLYELVYLHGLTQMLGLSASDWTYVQEGALELTVVCV